MNWKSLAFISFIKVEFNIYHLTDIFTDTDKFTDKFKLCKLFDKLRIIIKDECQKDVEIVGVADNIATMDYNHEKTAEIFIYGKHVDDFLNINHDHLLAYTVAHTQELYKKLSSALDRISYLEEEVSKMRAV